MKEPIKKRRSSIQVKRLRTLRAKKSAEEISRDARKAGLASPTKFTSERSRELNKKRWDAHRAAKEAEQQGEQ